jgi:glyoxylase-like metal-dependent hydrolase (beta-lactamase superfamily II)
MTVRKIGNATIEKVEEICGAGFKPARMFPKFDQEAFDAQKGWMVPDHVEPGSDRLVGSIHTWIVKTGRHTILIDTCLGNHKDRHNPGWNKLNTPFLERLSACGCKPESVDFVMCTHLHVDHVGWNTKLENGRWVPTFPNAKYLFAKREYAHWETEHKTQGKETNGGSFDDSVLPIVEAGKAVMIDSDHQPDPLLTIKDYPGHTPGSIAINLKDGGKQACFSGDIMHIRSRSITPTGRASSAPTRSCRQRAGASCSRIAARATRCFARLTFPVPMRASSSLSATPSRSNGMS